MKACFAGAFAVRLADQVQGRLAVPCDFFRTDEAGVVKELRDADILVSMAFNQAMSKAAPALRLIQVPGAGLDRIDRQAVPKGVHLANAYGHEAGIAEYIIGAMITLSRSFKQLDEDLRKGHWRSQWAVGAPAPPLWPELAGKTVGILGYGHIGAALTKRLRAFDMRVIAMRRAPDVPPPEGVEYLGGLERLDDILREADYLAVCLSLSPETRGLLHASRIQLLKPTAVIVNVARAEIIDESALFDALAQGRIAGAALDVWYRYPTSTGDILPAQRPFQDLPNVLMTPHVSGWTEGMLNARAQLIADNIARIANGEPPANAVK